MENFPEPVQRVRFQISDDCIMVIIDLAGDILTKRAVDEVATDILTNEVVGVNAMRHRKL